jgi:iron-sulfur cluster assembly accessory protein
MGAPTREDTMPTRESHLELTSVAALQLKRICLEEDAQPVVRLYIAGRTCCGYHFGLSIGEVVGTEDTVMEREGVRLVLDPQSREHCAGARVDYVDTGRGAGFIVDIPGTGGGCGCGGRPATA